MKCSPGLRKTAELSRRSINSSTYTRSTRLEWDCTVDLSTRRVTSFSPTRVFPKRLLAMADLC